MSEINTGATDTYYRALNKLEDELAETGFVPNLEARRAEVEHLRQEAINEPLGSLCCPPRQKASKSHIR